ncbi:MAG: DegT/DnrJ/EryC1/StrS family aminotransferase [Planctomycetes bacterium]|nr:DegT/DnrJ/EryC1/StrS family aminotransferase [Planctomycetota bacterium]
MNQPAAAPARSPVRTTPFPGLPPRFDGKEMEYLREALAQNSLFYNRPDGLVARMLKRACQTFNAPHAVATSSGTASLHVAVAASELPPGSEVITSPITDMGTCIAILYQNLVPVFADVDPETYNITAESIKAVMTERTRAVIAVHLTGAPCDMDPIVAFCKAKNLSLIEDCAQALGASYKGKSVGTLGRYGAYSLNDFKHLSCGDGGVVLAGNEADYLLAHNYADKFYDRAGKGVRLTKLGANYRMTELQGAVALAQFERLESIASKRNRLGDRLSSAISGIPGVIPYRVVPGAKSSYWFYMFRIDPAVLGVDRDEFSRRLNAEGIPAGGGYVAKPMCHEPVFLNKAFFPGGVWPAEKVAGKTYDYAKVRVPVCDTVLTTSIRMPLHEGMSEVDVDDAAKAIRLVAGDLARR